MANNFIKPGKHLTYTATTAIKSGSVVLFGEELCVALNTINAGDSGELAHEGIFELPKAKGTGIREGTRPVWSVTTHEALTGGSPEKGDLINSCLAVETALAAAVKVKVKLLPGCGRWQA
ncbi:DUF2190 family protein [Xylella fastidiosa subsp. multiplex]|uniref:DUF2190 family protein n=1 Tax=Xylella fastidiosa subsp. multiplex TaxID=644357 RepID=A0A9Q4MIH0_XYLFS|nr:DUF2190 family protein [Xylella fastidiosa]KAJ4853368.1 DUF2190 family protein [Xylella fastidiosa subsp. multiplex]MBE0269735.1 DUF2190 family protein [Xylella fastidiosa subsp. multiplex]MBE0276339.1 DUF2190 family protein [Xylella fastidiosa subsp. multiplex]MBE0278542.1 DUF2190 family protein [Xylella fastidiosa subsp. multiplex]MBE0282944.1 DUF2190 family protein [Xylella fastidiosa subsp. multiplex]